MVFTPFHMVAAGIGRLRRPAFDARAAVELTRFGLPFFPATRYALAPAALLTVLNDVVINDRKTVLELGSGYSSVYIAMTLEPRDGELFTVDANREWLDIVMGKARDARIAHRVRPVLAPLRSAPAPHEGDWYDLAAINAALGDRQIDLLLVDGPVASTPALARARAPAAHLLADRLADKCAVFLDDIHRPSHAAIAEDWSRALGMKFSICHARGGFAYGARGAAFDPII